MHESAASRNCWVGAKCWAVASESPRTRAIDPRWTPLRRHSPPLEHTCLWAAERSRSRSEFRSEH